MPHAQTSTNLETVPVGVHCPGCDYDLRSATQPRCPECGLQIDFQALRNPSVPWSKRKLIGRGSALAKTVRLFTIHPGRLSGPQCGSTLSDARRFQAIVSSALAVPLICAALILRYHAGDMPDELTRWFFVSPAPNTFGTSVGMSLAVCYWAGVTLWPVPAAALLLWSFSVTGAASYFFHPSGLSISRQNRAVALSYYTCGVLLCLPLVLVLIGGPLWFIVGVEHIRPPLDASGEIILGLLVVTILVTWAVTTLRALYVTTHRSILWLGISAAGWLFAELLVTLIVLGILPAAAGVLRLLLRTLQT